MTRSARAAARASLLASLLGLPPGCGLRDILPSGPVLQGADLAAFDTPTPAAVTYTGAHRVPFPVLPLQVFGVTYARDIVLVTDHPGWIMHEYARIDLPDRSLWVAKDTSPDGVQTIVADLADIGTWLPEIPVPRISAPIEVEDRAPPGSEEEATRVDVSLAYTNPAGEPVTLRYAGDVAKRPPRQRNGNTMGHSRQMAAVVLDLARFKHGGDVDISIAGKVRSLKPLFGIYPQKFLLDQTQAGVVVTRFRQSPTDAGFTLTRPDAPDVDWPTYANEAWTVASTGAATEATWDNGVVSFNYRFLDGGLSEATVQQAGRDDPALQMRLSPALPDLTRPFEGEARSRFTLDVNGQAGHGTGEVRARWDGPDRVVVDLIPTAPRWLVDRPMVGTVTYTDDGAAVVRMVRTEGDQEQVGPRRKAGLLP